MHQRSYETTKSKSETYW